MSGPSEFALMADLVDQRNRRSNFIWVLAGIIGLLCLVLVSVLVLQISQQAYLHDKSEQRDRFYCEMDHKLDLPTDWCKPLR